MRVARTLLLVTPFVTGVVLCFSTGRTSAHASRFELGRPIEGLSFQERKLFRDGKEAFEQVEAESDGLRADLQQHRLCHMPLHAGGRRRQPAQRDTRPEAQRQHAHRATGRIALPERRDQRRLSRKRAARGERARPAPDHPALRHGADRGDPGLPDRGVPLPPGRGCTRSRPGVSPSSTTSRAAPGAWGASAGRTQQATLPAFSGDAYLERDGDHEQAVPEREPRPTAT